MKKIIILTVLLSLMSSGIVSAENSKLDKLTRGFTNMVTAPVEIPRELRAHWIKGSEKTYHIIVWLFCGGIKGIVMTPVRIGSGIYDVVTFPIEYPKEYQPLLKPDYVFQDWPQREEGVIYKNIGDK